MGDFHQSGIISTLHRLGKPDVQRLEAELEHISIFRPIALVLPATATDLASEACQGIFKALEPLQQYLADISFCYSPNNSTHTIIQFLVMKF